MVSQVDTQASSISQAILLQSISNPSQNNSSSHNNMANNPISPSNSCFNTSQSSSINFNSTNTSMCSSSNSILSDDPIEEFDCNEDVDQMHDLLPKSSSFSVADTESEIESDNETEITALDETEDCPLSPAPTRANTGAIVTINSSIFQSVISHLKENERLVHLNKQQLSSELKYTIVLDIDETLLHSFFPEKVTPAQYQYVRRLAAEEEKKQTNGEINFEQREFHTVDVGDGTLVVAHLRPHMWNFLRSLFEQFNVAVWSAGGRLYVDNV